MNHASGCPDTSRVPLARRSRVALCAGLIALSFAVACGARDAVTPDGAVGGVMVVVQPASPSTLFPPSVSSNAALPIVHAVFDRLAEIGPSLNVSGDKDFVPRLASSWAWASDSLSIAFSLDPRVHWHDGAPLRAADVRFSFAAYTSDSVASDTKSLLGNIDSVTVRDSLTAVFWFKRRMPHQFFEATYHMYILPEHLLAPIGMGKLVDSPFAKNPIGTGQFRFEQWVPNVRIALVADTLNGRGRAKLDRLIFSLAPDYGAATMKLFAGDADFYEAIRPENLADAARLKTLRLVRAPKLEYGLLHFNLFARRDTIKTSPFFADVRVRRALGMGVDRLSMERNVLDTLGVMALAPVPRALIPDTLILKQPPFNVAAARAMLDSSGWVIPAGDSVRVRDGVRFAFEILAVSTSVVGKSYSVLLQQQLRALGIDVRVRTLDPAAIGEKLDTRDFDAFIRGWIMTPGRLGMGEIWGSRGSQNAGLYRSREFDAVFDSAVVAFDAESSKRLWSSALQLLIDDQPGIYLYEPLSPLAVHQRIRPAPFRPDAWYANIADWSVDPAQLLSRDGRGLRSAR